MAVCAICHGGFLKRSGNQLCGSKGCKGQRKEWKKRGRYYGGRCIECGRDFLAERSGHGAKVYCGPECKEVHRRKARRRAAQRRQQRVRPGLPCRMCGAATKGMFNHHNALRRTCGGKACMRAWAIVVALAKRGTGLRVKDIPEDVLETARLRWVLLQQVRGNKWWTWQPDLKR